MRVVLVALLALAAACGGAAAQNEAPQPLWRRDTTHLAADRQLARTCLQEAQRLRECDPAGVRCGERVRAGRRAAALQLACNRSLGR